MIVHVGGKRTHGRYLLLRQRVEFPGDKPVCTEEQGHQPLDHNETRRDQNQSSKLTARENQQNHRASPAPMVENNTDSLIGYMGKIQLTRKVMNFLVWLLLDSSKGSHKSKQVRIDLKPGHVQLVVSEWDIQIKVLQMLGNLSIVYQERSPDAYKPSETGPACIYTLMLPEMGAKADGQLDHQGLLATKWVEKVVWPSCLEAEDFVTTGPMLGFKVADQSMIVLNAQQSHWQRFMT
uniref:Uncharacterized protein n=1 Tax=Salix viminalis TaxID=40686 RepID=A0A6N2MDG6_SALVM